MQHWYLAITKLKSELRVKQNLWANHELTTFFPTFRPKKNASPIGLSLFPRYIFISCDLRRDFSKIQYTPGINRLVAFGDSHSPVSADVISCLKARCNDDDQIIHQEAEFEAGQQVRVVEL